MRKTFLFLLVLSLLLMPTLAHAQSNITIKELDIQLWPEHDRPDMLVMYTFSLSEEVSLPANIKIRIPANAELNAVAKDEGEVPINVPYDTSLQNDDWLIIALTITDLATYRVEYYAPLEKNGSTRNFSFLWESDYDAESLFIEFRQPLNMTNLTTTPTLPDSDREIYHTLTRETFSANESFSLEISYNKGNDDLMPVEVDGLGENASSSFSLSESLPTILVGLGILLIVGGLLYFFLAGHSRNTPRESRKRHKSSGGTKYCHECGSRASGNDKFCRSCGVKLRG